MPYALPRQDNCDFLISSFIKFFFLLIFAIFFGFFVFTANAEAATKYARNVTGNWSTDSTWSTTTGGAADTTAPTASDDAILDANSGNITIDTTTAVAKSVDQTGYTNTLTHTSAMTLTVSGSITLVASKYSAASATSSLVMNATGTLTTAGNAIGGFYCSSGTCTLGDNFTGFSSKLSNFIINGAVNLNGKTLSGNSVINRLFIYASSVGVAKTITVNSGTFANADFKDIAFANGGVIWIYQPLQDFQEMQEAILCQVEERSLLLHPQVKHGQGHPAGIGLLTPGLQECLYLKMML